MEIECKELLCKPDNIEYIRDQIGAILSTELANQFVLAQEASDPAVRDYNIGVYIENDDPLQLIDTADNPFPLVNITLASTERINGSTSINRHKMKAVFLIDAYAAGNIDSAEDAATHASIKAWKTARLVRNILCAENYAYLKMRGIVDGRDIMKFEAGNPTSTSSAIRVKIVRIILNVNYTEGVAINEGEILEQINATLCDENGKVLVEF